LDNNSFGFESISIKMQESIKMVYARIYKLGNFLDYCNHLQNWLSQCGIGRFQQWSLTTGTCSNIYTHCSLKEKPLYYEVTLHLKVNYALKNSTNVEDHTSLKENHVGYLYTVMITGTLIYSSVCNLFADGQGVHWSL